MDLRVNMTGKKTSFDQMLQSAEQQVKGFSSRVSSSFLNAPGGILGGIIGGFSFESIKGFVQSIFETAKGIRESAEQFDMTTDSVQRWEKALMKAGVTNQQFYRSMDTLRAKMQEAREDPTKRGDFRRVGLGVEDLASGNEESVLRQILSSGASRPEINALLGRGGAKLGAAMPYMSGSNPVYSETDLENVHKLETSSGKFWAGMKGVATKTVLGWVAFAKAGFDLRQVMINAATDGIAASQAQQKRTAQAKKDAEDEKAYNDNILARKRAVETSAQAVKAREYDIQLAEAQRHGMTPGQARADRASEIRAINKAIQNFDSPNDLWTADDTLRLNKLKTRRAQLMNEQRQAPPSFTADHLARVGLFSSASLQFNPALGIQQQQLQELRGIRVAVQKFEDPHKS